MNDPAVRARIEPRAALRAAAPVANCVPRDAKLTRDRAIVDTGGNETFGRFELLSRPHGPKLCGGADIFVNAHVGRIGTPRAWRNLGYAMDLGSIVFGHGGSSPPARTFPCHSSACTFAIMGMWLSVIATNPAGPEAAVRATPLAGRFRKAAKAFRASQMTSN